MVRDLGSLRRRLDMVLHEHFTRDPALNAEIERRFLTLPDPMRRYVRDAAEVLHGAGGEGLTKMAWAARVAELWPEGGQEPRTSSLGAVLTATHRLFPEHISLRDGVVRWDDVPAGLRAAMRQGVELASACLSAIKGRPLSLESWADAVSAETGVPAEVVRAYIRDHVVPHMGGAITMDDAGLYSLAEPTDSDAMELLRQIASGERQVPLD